MSADGGQGIGSQNPLKNEWGNARTSPQQEVFYDNTRFY